MFKNYFKTAWRNLIKDKTHALINIIGLSIGMAVAIMIGLWMYDEISFDKNFKSHDRIAQVIQNVTNNGEVQTWRNVPYPLASELRTNYGSDFKYIVMAVDWNDHLLTIGNKKLKQSGGFFENQMPEMLTLDMTQGNRNALNDPSSILISSSSAKAYFGSDNPINKIIKIDQMPPVKVAGIYKDFPQNSTFANLNFIASWNFWYAANNYLKDMEDPWRPNFATLFVQLNDNADINSVNAKIRDAKLKKVNPQLQKKKPTLFLDPMNKWHLYSAYKNGVNVGGAIQYVWMFGIIGLFVLLLACINFMNLSTAKSEKRAKEVGIRKTVGSLRKQLIIQFFSESLLTVLLSFALAILFVQLSLSLFNQVAQKQMSLPWNNITFWLICFAFVIVTSLIAGSYPAFYLSSFRPVSVLKGTFKAGRYAALPRKVLVVLQFTVSVSLVIATIVVYQQIQFAKNRPVGYSRENLVSVPTADSFIHVHFDAVKRDLMQTGMINSVAESQSPLTGIYGSTSGFSWPGKDPNLSVDFKFINASVDYGKTINWQIKEGRDFSKDFITDTSAVILNEAAVHYMQLKNPVGTKVTWWDQPLTVIGVINNMVTESPYDEATPVIYTEATGQGNFLLVKLSPTASAKNAISSIESIFKKYDTEEPFEYHFTDEDYAKKFDAEERIGKLANIFTLLAVIISCLGLFGLTSFIAEKRKKEVGIRKVLGASIFTLWNLLSKDFVKLVVISFLIAVPLSWYFMHNWLQNYSYRTSLSWWIFLIAGIGAIIITVITVSFQAIKAAISNPVKSLRTE